MSSSSITKLRLSHFRNYVSFEASFEASTIVLTGENGAGKTNLLEALSFLSPGRGLRNAKLSQVTTIPLPPSPTWALSADLSVPLSSATEAPPIAPSVVLGTGLEFTPSARERRLVKINGIPAKSQASLTDWLNVVWVTPFMSRLFLESGTLKRKFIDRLIYALDPQHAERLQRYEHALKERSTLLANPHGHGPDPLWLSQVEAQLSAQGVAIVAARRQGLKLIEEIQQTAPHLFTPEGILPNLNPTFPRFQISFEGILEQWMDAFSPPEVEAKMATHLKEKRRQDAQTGTNSIGPQKSVLIVTHTLKGQRAEFCSTGEQKMLLLAIVFAFMRLLSQRPEPFAKERPLILLLDDVVAHLDSGHRVLLFEQIETLQLQAWLTGTESALFQELKGRAQFFKVHNSKAICEPF